MKRFHRILALLVATLAALLTLSLGSAANAFSVKYAGTTGNFSVSQANGAVSGTARYLTVPPVSVGRAPVSTAPVQKIWLEYSVFRVNPSNPADRSLVKQVYAYNYAATGGVSLPQYRFALPAGTYDIEAYAYWGKAQTDSTLGWKTVNWDTADFNCSTGSCTRNANGTITLR